MRYLLCRLAGFRDTQNLLVRQALLNQNLNISAVSM